MNPNIEAIMQMWTEPKATYLTHSPLILNTVPFIKWENLEGSFFC